jgi:hypothetical protein
MYDSGRRRWMVVLEVGLRRELYHRMRGWSIQHVGWRLMRCPLVVMVAEENTKGCDVAAVIITLHELFFKGHGIRRRSPRCEQEQEAQEGETYVQLIHFLTPY